MEVIGQHYDVAVIGGGIVGVALAYELLNRRPQLRLALLEKESQLGEHQTGHNSGVLHSGIYYRPGSLKAQLCVEGARRMAELCEARSLPFSRCGKVIVATEEAELPILADLYQRGLANGVPGVQMLEPQQLRAIEPHASEPFTARALPSWTSSASLANWRRTFARAGQPSSISSR